jgi:hypothetical protein
MLLDPSSGLPMRTFAKSRSTLASSSTTSTSHFLNIRSMAKVKGKNSTSLSFGPPGRVHVCSPRIAYVECGSSEAAAALKGWFDEKCASLFPQPPKAYILLLESDFQNRRATATPASTTSGNPFRTLPKGDVFEELPLLASFTDVPVEPPPRENRGQPNVGAVGSGGMGRGGGAGGNFRGGATNNSNNNNPAMANAVVGMGMPMNASMMRMMNGGMPGMMGANMGMANMGMGMGAMGMGMGGQGGAGGYGRGGYGSGGRGMIPQGPRGGGMMGMGMGGGRGMMNGGMGAIF